MICSKKHFYLVSTKAKKVKVAIKESRKQVLHRYGTPSRFKNSREIIAPHFFHVNYFFHEFIAEEPVVSCRFPFSCHRGQPGISTGFGPKTVPRSKGTGDGYEDQMVSRNRRKAFLPSALRL